jgi:4-amino-4-deoxy-L-arabinose transferase-like glycosyltransferase
MARTPDFRDHMSDTTQTDAPSLLSTIEQRPRDAAYLYIIWQVVIWTLVPYFIAISLPLDVVSDGLGWGHEWQLGYFKHPPLPSWLVEMFFDVLGDLGPFLLSQIAIAVTCLFVFALGRAIMGERKAAFGTVLLAGVWYFSVPSPEWNHNVAQMPAWAAMTFLFYKSLKTGDWRWWVLLGFAAGIGLLMKYSTAVLMAVMFLYMLVTRDARAKFLTVGPYAALVICFVTISPHVAWLIQNNFPTLHYAAERAGESSGVVARILLPFKFIASQLIDLLPAVAVAVFVGLIGRDTFRKIEADDDLRFLLWMGLGPALLTAALSLVAGFGLRAMWGTPMWNLTGLIIVALAGARGDQASFPRLAIGTAALLIIMPLIFWFTTSLGPQLRGHVARSAWPDKVMAKSFDQSWQLTAGRPLTIVAGDGWLAGLIAMRSDPRASVFTDGDMQMAPWITPQRLTKEGVLVVWQVHKGESSAPPAGLAALPHFKEMGIDQFSWPRARKAQPLTVGWGIVPPQR